MHRFSVFVCNNIQTCKCNRSGCVMDCFVQLGCFLMLGADFASLSAGQDLDVTGYLFPGPRFTGSHFDVASDQLVSACGRRWKVFEKRFAMAACLLLPAVVVMLMR